MQKSRLFSRNSNSDSEINSTEFDSLHKRSMLQYGALHCVQRRTSMQRTAPNGYMVLGSIAPFTPCVLPYALHCITLWCRTATSPYHSTVSPAKMVEQIVMPFGRQMRLGPKNYKLDWSTYGHHPVNTIQRPLLGSDVVYHCHYCSFLLIF